MLCPNINDNDKEWCKELVETMVKKELEKTGSGVESMGLGNVRFDKTC